MRRVDVIYSLRDLKVSKLGALEKPVRIFQQTEQYNSTNTSMRDECVPCENFPMERTVPLTFSLGRTTPFDFSPENCFFFRINDAQKRVSTYRKLDVCLQSIEIKIT